MALVACIIIALKLVYRLDRPMNCRDESKEYLTGNRLPKDKENVGCAMGHTGEYLEEMKKTRRI